MADNISDKDLRNELKRLTGKEVGPITASTKPVLLKRLLKLREGGGGKPTTTTTTSSTPISSNAGSNHKKNPRKTPKQQPLPQTTRSAPNVNNFGFSSDEEQADNNATSQRQITNNKRRSTTTSTKTILLNKSSSLSRPAPAKHGATNAIPSEEQLMKLSNEEIQSKLLSLTGTRYPITDSTTKRLHVKRLRKMLAGGDGQVTTSTQFMSRTSVDTSRGDAPSLPMETTFSDSDDEGDFDMMDFETSADSAHSPSSADTTRPAMVNQSVNTSSFLDRTRPDPSPDDDPDCFVMPTYHSRVNSDGQISSTSKSTHSDVLPDLPSKLPSPNLSSTRRSFVPHNSPRCSSKPPPASPPRSTFARRPLTTGTHFINISPEVTPKPTSRFSAALARPKPSAHLPDRDYSTGYSTGGGKVISPAPAKRAKVAKDVDMAMRDKGKHPSYVYSRALVVALGLFLTVLVLWYVYLRLTTPEPLESVFAANDVYEPLLKDEERNTCPYAPPCFPQAQLRGSKPVVDMLRTYLAQHAGYSECKYAGYEERYVAQGMAKQAISELYGKDAIHLWPAVLQLIARNPHWGIKMLGQDLGQTKDVATMWWLESEVSVKPWTCMISSAMSRMGVLVLALLTVASLGYLAFLYGSHWKRKLQHEENVFFELVENIIDMLETQYKLSRGNIREQPFLAISHVHDSLINPPDRVQMQAVWKRAVKFIKDNETRVREEVQQVAGEEFTVWRWIQSADPKPAVTEKRWQGSAVGAHKLNFKPTQCLKIRGMFDVYCESGTEWPIHIQDAILEKLGDNHGVVHIAVDTESDENRVYAKFDTSKHAGKAFESLNGSYFAGQCVQCKFLLLNKYHQKFPHAVNSTTQLRRSNEQPSVAGSKHLYPSLRTYQ